MKEQQPEATLQVMFCERIRHVPSLAADIAVHDRAEPGTTDRSYSFLVKSVKRVLERNKQEKNRLSVTQSMDIMNKEHNIAAVKGRGKGNPKGRGKCDKNRTPNTKAGDNACRAWAKTGTCPRGNSCPYDHSGNRPAKTSNKDGGNPKPKGKGKGRPKLLCKFFAQGNCTAGDKCTYSHTGGSPLAPVQQTAPDQPKPAAEARPKQKAKEQKPGNC